MHSGVYILAARPRDTDGRLNIRPNAHMRHHGFVAMIQSEIDRSQYGIHDVTFSIKLTSSVGLYTAGS